jgi:hypothetical protein
MKKLNKLQINREKIIKQEELLILKGGYDGQCDYYCWVGVGTYPNFVPYFSGVGCGSSAMEAQADCNSFYSGMGFTCQCI